jgi:hypothetical protein
MASSYATGEPGKVRPSKSGSTEPRGINGHAERVYYDDCESQHGEKGKNCLVQGTGDVVHMCEPHAKGY